MPTTAVNMGQQFRESAKLPDNIQLDDNSRMIKGVVFSTGQRGLRYDWWTGEAYYEELEISESAIRSERLDKGLSIIDSHRSYAGIDGVYGVTEDYRIENGELIGDLRFASDDDSVKQYDKVKDRILRHFSLGYKVHRMKYMGDADDGIPIYRAVDWETTELSIVPVSFETNNGTRADQGETPRNAYRCDIETEDSNMKLPFQTMTRGLGLGSNVLQTPSQGNDPAPQATPEPTPEPQQGRQNEPAPAPVATPEPQQGRQNEPAPAPAPTVTRADIMKDLPQFQTIGRKCGLSDEQINEAFSRGDTLAQFREFALEQLTKDSDDKIHGRTRGEQEDHDEKQRDAAVNYLLHRGGQGAKQTELSEMGRQYQGMRLMDMVRHFTKSGFGESQQKIAGRAFQTTSDFPLILENVMHKTMQMGYDETPRTFLGIPMIQNASDFREQNVYRLGDAPDLRRLKEHGEYESGSFGSEKESFYVDTFARSIAVTRQVLINDDMNALANLPFMFGVAGSRLESDLFWGMVLNWDFQKNEAADFKMRDGFHLFDKTNHNNVIDGATSALAKEGLSKFRKLGRDQKTVDGNYMNVEYDVLVVPNALETTASDLLYANTYPDDPAKNNSFRGQYDLRIEPRLSAVPTIGDTAYYGFSNRIKAMVMSYLDGEQGMYSEVENMTSADGMRVLARKDVGVGMVDWRGAAKSKGKA